MGIGPTKVQAQAIPDFERIACEQVEALTLLFKVQPVLKSKPRGQFTRVESEEFASLIVFEVRGKDRESRRDRTIHQVRLREAELILGLPRSALKADRKRFTETKEIVGFVIHAHEAAANSADAPAETDRIAASFLYL